MPLSFTNQPATVGEAPAHGLHLMWCQYERLENGLVVPLPKELNLNV